MARIICPNKEYTGVSAGVLFAGGVGETEDRHLIEWFKSKGYTVEDESPEGPPKGTPEALEDMTVKQLQGFAAEKGINVEGLKKKAEMLEKIRTALNEPCGEDSGNGNEKGDGDNGGGGADDGGEDIDPDGGEEANEG